MKSSGRFVATSLMLSYTMTLCSGSFVRRSAIISKLILYRYAVGRDETPCIPRCRPKIFSCTRCFALAKPHIVSLVSRFDIGGVREYSVLFGVPNRFKRYLDGAFSAQIDPLRVCMLALTTVR